MNSKFQIYDGDFKYYFPKALWGSALIYAIWILTAMWRESFTDKRQVLPHLAIWLLIPPVWFVIEYNFFFKNQEKAEDRFEAFKHGQELNRNLWAAISAILLAVYFS